MTPPQDINSKQYWDHRFDKDWVEKNGPKQSRFFARLAVANLPAWLFREIRRENLTVVDWGCAQGDGTDLLSTYISSSQVIGVDFSTVAIGEAVRRYPGLRFFSENWLDDEGGKNTYDVVFSSNTLEHFHQPYEVLGKLVRYARKAIVLAMPYREHERFGEHFYTFLEENIPLELHGGFRLAWSRVVDCRSMANTLWHGDQIFLIYGSPKWLSELKLTLGDCLVEHTDSQSDLAALEVELARYVDLVKALQAENDSLKQRLEDALLRATDAEQRVRDAEARFAQADTLRNNWEYKALALEASTSWRVTKPLRTLTMLRRIVADGPIAPRVARLGAFGRKRGWRAAAGIIIKKLQSNELRSAAPSVSMLDSLAERIAIFVADRRVAVVPCAFEFDELVNQRPINLSKHLAAKGYRVLFVAWQWSASAPLARVSGEVYPGVMQVGLYEFLALHPRILCRNPESLFLITFPAEQIVRAARAAREKQFRLIYDILDDWAEFKVVGHAPWFIEALEHQAVLEADLVTAVSPPLADKFATLRSDVVVVRNGFNPATIGTSSRNVAGSVATPTHGLVAGYFGHLTSAWFDWALVLDCARSNSDVLFELIGYDAPDHILDEARELPNISLVPATQPSELRNFVCRWNVGLIPFKPGPLAEAVDPIKIYEYLYMGLPVVVTGISHLASYPNTIVVEERSSAVFGAAIRAHAAKAKVQGAEQDLSQFLLGSTWEARFGLMLGHVETAPHLGLLHG